MYIQAEALIGNLLPGFMNKKLTKIRTVWKSYEDRLGKEEIRISSEKLDNILNSIFCPGPFYFYILDISSMQFSYVHPNIEQMLGINPEEASIELLAQHVHPEDADHIIKCEEVAQTFLFSAIQPEKMKKYKVSYCYRLKSKSGAYKLFLHQAITIALDQNGRISTVLGIHSDISHITDQNNLKLSFIDLEQEADFLNIDPKSANLSLFAKQKNPLSKRELEIVQLLTEGWTSKQVAETLFLSPDTIRTHRNNIRKKLKVKNTTQMVAACIRAGYI